jgi:hypothetical protein
LREVDGPHEKTTRRVFFDEGRTTMLSKDLDPILNVSDIQQSFAWFEKLGWKKLWDWGDPPTFGSVSSGSVRTKTKKTALPGSQIR